MRPTQGRSKTLIHHLKDWWWLYGAGSALCGLIVLWGGLPNRIAKAEEQLEQVDEDVDDLKGWARQIQGYTEAMQQQRQQAPTPSPNALKVQEWQDADGTWWCCTQACDYNDAWYVCQ